MLEALGLLLALGGGYWFYKNTEYKENPITDKKQFFFITTREEVTLGNVLVAHLVADYDSMILSAKENQNLEILQENVLESFGDIAKKYFGAKLKGLEGKGEVVSH